MLKRWQAVCNTRPDLAGVGFELQTSLAQGGRYHMAVDIILVLIHPNFDRISNTITFIIESHQHLSMEKNKKFVQLSSVCIVMYSILINIYHNTSTCCTSMKLVIPPSTAASSCLLPSYAIISWQFSFSFMSFTSTSCHCPSFTLGNKCSLSPIADV